MNQSAIKQTFRFIVEAQVWIALCALAAANTTSLLYNGHNLSWEQGLLVFSTVLCAYSWYYFKNKQYPMAPYFAITMSIASVGLYAYSEFPNPIFIASLILLSSLYMIPLPIKKPHILIIRWLILTIVWTLFTYYTPIINRSKYFGAAIFFAYRILSIGNLGFIFLIKDERIHFSEPQIKFIKNLLLTTQGLSIIGLLWFSSVYLALSFGLIFLFLILFYKIQTPQSSIYFYSLGIDGLLILESIFVQSLFYYGLGRFPAF